MAAITVDSPVHRLFVLLEDYHADANTKDGDLDNDWHTLRCILRNRAIISGKAPISEMLQKDKRQRIIDVFNAKQLIENVERALKYKSDNNSSEAAKHLTLQQVHKIHKYKKFHDTAINKFANLCKTVLEKTDVKFKFDNPDTLEMEERVSSGVLRIHPDPEDVNKISFEQLKETEEAHVLFKHKVAQMGLIVKFFEKVIDELES